MAMLRHRHAVASHVPTRLLVSARGADDVLYSAELAELAEADDGFELLATLTRDGAAGLDGLHPPRRPRDAGGGRLGPERARAHLRLRTDRRSSRPPPRGSSGSATIPRS